MQKVVAYRYMSILAGLVLKRKNNNKVTPLGHPTTIRLNILVKLKFKSQSHGFMPCFGKLPNLWSARDYIAME